jgi:hypothetical protein
MTNMRVEAELAALRGEVDARPMDTGTPAVRW